jgi:UDP-glucuronate 4-epimerase
MTILVTGAAGFIGYHLCRRLLERGETVVGVDNLNAYYDPSLKRDRLAQLEPGVLGGGGGRFVFVRASLEEAGSLDRVFAEHRPHRVVNLAAQAGVRHSIDNPSVYVQANLVGFGLLLEACRHHRIEHLVYASSSSVYGGNTELPFRESQPVNHPVSLYAATKKANELMAHTYSHLYQLPATGLRFFTVYGPWGRPDMALFLFTRSILNGEPIKVFNHGQMVRDFTYIDDIIESLVRVLDKPATGDPAFDPARPDPATSWAPHRLFNIGNCQPTPLRHYIEAIEAATGRTAIQELLPMQPGDLPATAADCSRLETWTGFRPATPVAEGVARFVAWYGDYYGA